MTELYKDYISAEITLFWTINDSNDEQRLIFAVTEFVPMNQLPSRPLGGGQSPYLSCTVRSLPKIHICCRRYFCSIDDALECFNSSDWSRLPDGPQKLICCQHPRREPTAGFSVVLSKGHVPLYRQKNSLEMVLPNRPASFRACSVLDNISETEKAFSKADRGKIAKFVRKYCGADLQQYSEFWGANILCMQNPVLWGLNTCISDDKKTFRFLIMLRDGQTAEGMHCMICARHTFGPSCSDMQQISSESFSLPAPADSSNTELLLWGKNGDLLEIIPLTFFGGKLWTSTNTRKLPNGKSIAIWSKKYYEARKHIKNILETSEEKRLYRLLEAKREFCYFKAGDILHARNLIGSILANSGLHIVVCDPYLDADGFDNHLKGWIKCANLTLYASKNWLIKIGKDNVTTRQAELENRITTMKNAGDIECAQLYGIFGGDQGFVHDRFIITENGVWCIGSSLNNFGQRDTVLIKSPNPEAFIERVAEWKSHETNLLREWR